ncbi:hypothetical protein BDV25DRAFT_140494 [Aspergillus avenaceus]|uniref:Uncharacterized protein n=1 Tax=Aspergillus avenaceus TaxID=36643 RepID=A0A5N6TU09_ASPAV|nr:hypothetical protein BDV25DRAFT_140494 [Aspergillus avenaceus]
MESTDPGYIIIPSAEAKLTPKDQANPREINSSIGVLSVIGSLDPNTWIMDAEVKVAGISLGRIKGNLNDGVWQDVNLAVAKWYIKFYRKENEAWMTLDLNVMEGDYKGDYRISAPARRCDHCLVVGFVLVKSIL